MTRHPSTCKAQYSSVACDLAFSLSVVCVQVSCTFESRESCSNTDSDSVALGESWAFVYLTSSRGVLELLICEPQSLVRNDA